MESKLSEQESIAVINEMIDRVQNNIRKGSGNSMIYWGYAVAFTAMLNFILLFFPAGAGGAFFDGAWAFHVWWLMLPFAAISFRLEWKRNKEAIVKTHLDSIIKSIWHGFTISYMVVLGVIFSLCLYENTWWLCFFIPPVVLVLTGFGNYVTAQVSRFKPFKYGAFCMFVGAVICAAPAIIEELPSRYQFLVLAVSMILGFVIPGTMLNKKADSHV
ncbi:MAG: hypothetical protein LBT35_06645 [Tannerella sp.]|jgi:hypothetical protein|nr:hypothetical protein [Tannerella sp.]